MTPRPWAGTVALALLIAAMYWRLLSGQYVWFDHPDGVSQVLPWFQFQLRSWTEGDLPLWDPNHYGGQSLVGQVQPGALYPLNVAFFLLAAKTGGLTVVHLNLYYVALHYLAALVAFGVCLRLGLGTWPAVIAGVVFSCSGYVGTSNWPQMMNSAMFTPAILLFALPRPDGRLLYSDAVRAGAFLGLALLGGHHQVPTFTAVALLALLGLAARWTATPAHRIAAHAACLFTTAALVSAIQLLPAYEYGLTALRWINTKDPVTLADRVPYTAHAAYSAQPIQLLLGWIVPGTTPHTEMYCGIAVICLAAIGVAARASLLHVRLLLAAGLCGVLLALGDWSLIHGLAYLLAPGVDKARNPSTALALSAAAISVLAAYGAKAILDGEAGRALTKMRLAATAVAVLGGVTLFVAYPLTPQTGGTSEYAWLVLACAAVAGVLWARDTGRISNAASVTMMGVIAALQLYPLLSARFLHLREQEGQFSKISRLDAAARFVRDNLGNARVDAARDAVPFNFGDWYGVPQFDGLVSVSRDFFQVMFTERAKDLLAVKYVIASKPPEGAKAVFPESEASAIRVWERPAPRPRAWIAYQVKAAPTAAAALDDLADPSVDLAGTVSVLNARPRMQPCDSAGDQVTIQALTNQEVRLRVIAACPGVLVLSDAHAPGWHVQVNGAGRPVLPVFALVRGVEIDAGISEVVFRYHPRSVILGATLSGVGLILVAAFSLSPGLRRH